jgi:hypothetical protein
MGSLGTGEGKAEQEAIFHTVVSVHSKDIVELLEVRDVDLELHQWIAREA